MSRGVRPAMASAAETDGVKIGTSELLGDGFENKGSHMGSAFQIAMVNGIRIRVHWTLIAFLAWIAFGSFMHHGFEGASVSIAMVVMVFGFIVLHELGHAVMAQRFGVSTLDITLLPIGGVARIQKIPEDPRQELLIALAGPAVNVILAAIFALAICLTDGWRALFVIPSLKLPILNFALLINTSMAVFNLLPALPMDGGRVLRAVLATRMSYLRATEIAATVGQAFAIALGVLGIYGNGMLIFIALFVYFGAQQEAFVTKWHAALNHVGVREAMRSHFTTLTAGAPISSAIHDLIADGQHDFPVVDDQNRLCGILYRDDLLNAWSQNEKDEPVSKFMESVGKTVSCDDTLEKAFEAMNELDRSVLPVVRHDRIVGLISLENIGEWMLVHSTQHQPKGQPAVRDWSSKDTAATASI